MKNDKLSADAADFKPEKTLPTNAWSNTAGGSKLAATANEFVPGSKLTADANEFVPNKAKLTSAASEFVPGQAAWAWSSGASRDVGHWSYGAAGTTRYCSNEAALMGYASSIPPATDGGCWFNADAYSTDSSSPRASDLATEDLPDAGSATVAAAENAVATATAPLSNAALVAGADCGKNDASAMLAMPQKTGAMTSQAQRNTKSEDSQAAAEMSETTMKEWLKRFADDGSIEAFRRQWQLWTVTADQEERRKRGHTVVAWLLKVGLDDCRRAHIVEKALVELVSFEKDLVKPLVEAEFAQYSGEDLEDIALDNPRVGEFVGALRKLLAEPASSQSAAARVPESHAPRNIVTESVEIARSCGSSSSDPAATRYSSQFLLSVRCRMLRAGAMEDADCQASSMPRWRSEPAANFDHLGDRERTKARSRLSSSKSEGSGWRSGGEIRSAAKKAQTEPAITASPTSWAAQQRRSKEAKQKLDEGAAADEHTLREMRGTLNKLTVEKFDQLSDHLLSIIGKSTRPNRGIPMLMQLLFEKATTQHHFINMYVGLCVKLHRWLTEEGKASSVDAQSQSNFKRILLNQCQTSFEQYLEPPDGFEGLIGDALYECQVKYKTKMLGNIKLVGELIKHGMLVSKIAIAVSEELVRDDPVVREERLETLSVFLETVGPALDEPSWTHYPALSRIFTQVEMLTKDATLPCRIRCLLRDTLDLRRCHWQAKKASAIGTEGPTTIAEVHEKARQSNSGHARDRRASSGSELSVGAMAGKQTLSLRSRSGWGYDSSSSAGEDAAPTYVGRSPAASSRPADAVMKRKPQPSKSTVASPTLSPSKLPPASPHSAGVTQGATTSASSVQLSPSVAPKNGDFGPASVKSGSHATQVKASAPAVSAVSAAAAGVNGVCKPASQVAASGTSGAASPLTRKEILQAFHKELATTIRQLGSGSLSVPAAVERLRAGGPLPPGCELEEAADLIARIVDEPKPARQRLIPLLPALVNSSVLAAPGIIQKAVENFAEDAFADPDDVDPPNLAEILVSELLPALGLVPSALDLPVAVVA